MMKMRIRPIAVGIFLHDQRLLVFEGYDDVKQKRFFRPLGGALKFGETGAEAIQREIKEETDFDAGEMRYLGLIENRFFLRGEPGHELVLVYTGIFTDDRIYKMDAFIGHEDDGSAIQIRWVEVEYFKKHRGLLVPDELLSMIDPLLSS